jgi:hypothetical protein
LTRSGTTTIYVQKAADGKLQSISFYDDAGKRFSMEHYNQKAPHKLIIDGEKVNLKNTPHEHQTRVLDGQNGAYQKKQVRLLDENGKPISGWVNEK